MDIINSLFKKSVINLDANIIKTDGFYIVKQYIPEFYTIQFQVFNHMYCYYNDIKDTEIKKNTQIKFDDDKFEKVFSVEQTLYSPDSDFSINFIDTKNRINYPSKINPHIHDKLFSPPDMMDFGYDINKGTVFISKNIIGNNINTSIYVIHILYNEKSTELYDNFREIFNLIL